MVINRQRLYSKWSCSGLSLFQVAGGISEWPTIQGLQTFEYKDHMVYFNILVGQKNKF